MPESFGARLRQQREERGIALAAIAKQTRIKEPLLEGLERDDLSQWPTGFYRRAFFRAYAGAIGLEPDAAFREFAAAHPEPPEVDVLKAMAMALERGEGSGGPAKAIKGAFSALSRFRRPSTPAQTELFSRAAEARPATSDPGLATSDPAISTATGAMERSILGLMPAEPAGEPTPNATGFWESTDDDETVRISAPVLTSDPALISSAGEPIFGEEPSVACDRGADFTAQMETVAESHNGEFAQPSPEPFALADSDLRPRDLDLRPQGSDLRPRETADLRPRDTDLRPHQAGDLRPQVGETPVAIDVSELAKVCNDLARASELQNMQPVLREVARILNARGLIVWLWDDIAGHLEPALVHGYSDRVVAQLPAVRHDADNATAAAFRTARLRFVSGEHGCPDAVVVPLLSSVGCVGVLAVELQRGAPSTNTLEAIAMILAAPLAVAAAAFWREIMRLPQQPPLAVGAE